MIKKIWKYLLGGLAGAVLCGAVVGGVVSCSNGNQTQTTQSTQKTDTTKPEANKPTTSTAPSNQTQTTKPVSKPTTSTAAYELINRINTSSIAYKNPTQQNTTEMSMVATKQPDNYATLINKPNNVIISVLGHQEAVINVKNDTSTNDEPNITLNLNPNSDFYKQVLNGTSNLTELNNLINFSTTNKSTDKFDINNLSLNHAGNVVPTNSWTFSLKDFVPTFASGEYGNTSSDIGATNNGLTVLANLNTFWTDIHAKNPTATFTFTNELYWITEKNGKKLVQQVPFKLTIDLLPLVQFSNQHPTIQITNQKTGAWELTNLPKEDAPEFIYTDGMWATNYNYFESPAPNQYYSIPLPKTSVPYVYINAQNMIVVGTTSESVL